MGLVLSKQIIDGIYAPAFREQRYAEGLLQGFEIMTKARRGENVLSTPVPEPASLVVSWDGAGGRFLLSLALNLLPAVLYAAAMVYGRRHGRGQGGRRPDGR